MRKIILLGLQSDTNLGDPLIGECTGFLVRKALDELGIDDIELEQVDMRGFDYGAYSVADRKAAEADEARRRNSFIEKLRRKILRTFAPDRYQQYKDSYAAAKKQRKAEREERNRIYRAKMAGECALRVIDENTAAVIFVGGGLIKYGHNQRLGEMMAPYVDRANELGVPVMFNSVGLEGYDIANEECRELCRILNLPCVKTVSARDDIAMLEDFYITSDHVYTVKTPDSALWTNEVYPQERQSRGLIGLGMARGGLYIDHGGVKGEAELLALWSEILDELDKRGYDWRLFGNGLYSDWKFGAKLLEHIGRSNDADTRLIRNPETVEEFVSTICMFDCVAASRLHAAITSYSYGIPVVEIVWNAKQRMFAQWAGIDDLFIDEDKVTATDFVDAIERAMSTPSPKCAMNRDDTYRCVRSFLENNIR